MFETSLELEYTKYLPLGHQSNRIEPKQPRRTKSHIFTNGGGEAISKNLELRTQLAGKICKGGSGI